jgi:MSHA biogenesis protein MshN
MSLVNNMLRDLDQRRKDSSTSAGAMKLMPASEFIGDGKKDLLPYAILGLILLSSGLVYYWYSMNKAGSEQQLDMQVRSPLTGLSVDSEQLIQELEESILLSEEAFSREELIGESAPLENPGTRAVISESRLEPEENSPLVENLIAELVVEAETPRIRSVEPNQEAIASELSVIAADPELIRNNSLESVKEAPEYSNEQQDTIAVQEALRQISNGRTEDAYETLEQFIASNRYAHQSRETYAKLLMRQGNVQEANSQIAAGLELAPNHTGFKKVKARLLMGAGEIGEAVNILITRAPEIEEDSEYHDLLASAQLSSRDYSGAVISYRGLVQHDQTQGKWWYGFAAAHDQLGNSGEARQAYSQAIKYSNLSANLRRRSQERLGALSPQ